MASEKQTTISDSLDRLIQALNLFDGVMDNETVNISGQSGRTILQTLRFARHMALLQERELGALRMAAGDVSLLPASDNSNPSPEGKIVPFPRRKPRPVQSPDRDPA